MVQTRPPIRPVEFRSSVHPMLPVEVIDRADLLTRMASQHFEAPQRVAFDAFLLMRSADSSHTVDFVEIPAQPGRLIQVRAGQSQTWNTADDAEATLVLGETGALSRRAWFPGDASYVDLPEQRYATACAIIDLLRHEQQRFDGDEPSVRLMVVLFDALRALFDQASTNAASAALPGAYIAFRSSLEAHLTSAHDVEFYADLLGYSTRTITRACLQVTGQSAKHIITERLTLEAKRMLVQSGLTISQVAEALGFSEPTNFTKFFVRSTNTTPLDYRRRYDATSR